MRTSSHEVDGPVQTRSVARDDARSRIVTAKTERAARRFSLGEEDAVSLTSEHRNQVPRRVGCLRLEVEAGLIGRPLDRGSRAEERTLEGLSAVVNFRHRDDSIPFHIE